MGVLNHLSAGDLTYKVTVFKQVTTVSDAGAAVHTQTTVAADVRASIKNIAGREFWSAKQVRSDATFRIMLRYDSRYASWNPDYQIVWGTRTFEAVGPVKNLDERGITIEILAKEVAPKEL